MKNLLKLLDRAHLKTGNSQGDGLGALYLLLIWVMPFLAAYFLGVPAVAALAPILRAIIE